MKISFAGLLLLLSQIASAAIFTVTNNVDPGDGSCEAAGCTLREAINAANANPGADIIRFNIPFSGVQMISPASSLPTITDAVTIDGYTQPGTSKNTLAVGNNAVLLIELDGTFAGSLAIGLNIAANNTVIRGLVINRFSTGININSDANIIEGNFVGTNAAGTADLGNRFGGVSITVGNNNLVGGDVPRRNVISGNDGPA